MRFYHVAEGLRSHGHLVDTFQVTQMADTGALSDLLAHCDHLVLPLPAFDAGGCVSSTCPECTVHISQLLNFCGSGTMVFGGKLGAYSDDFWKTGATVIDYYEDDILTAVNSVPTAEGALQLAMERMPGTIWQSKCLVIGFGRIGKVLSAKLSSLGADVTVAARKDADRGLIQALGYRSDSTRAYHQPLEQYDLIVNTVPAPVFTAAQYAAMQKSCVLLDLASVPGGISPEQCRQHQLSFCHALSLPGKVAPAAAGRLIVEAIERHLS